MRIKNAFRLSESEAARAISAHPLGTFVAPDLQVTRMPCLLEAGDGLTILSHVAHADPFSKLLGGPLLAIFSGPQGYISASWYEADTIPTWNNVTVYLRGTPECFEDAMPVLRRTVDHFEAAVEHPWSLDRLEDGGRGMADKVTAFKLRAEAWWGEDKLSQDKPPEVQDRLIASLQAEGPYHDAALAAAMRQA